MNNLPRVIFIFILVGFSLFCQKREGGGSVFSVEMSATPSVVRSGEYLYRCLTAKNQGRKTIKIYRMSVWEECIGGWREGESDTLIDWSFSPPLVPEVKPGRTDTLFWLYSPVYNEGESDLEWRCIGRLDWDERVDSDTTSYLIRKANGE